MCKQTEECTLAVHLDRLGLVSTTGRSIGCITDPNWLDTIGVQNHHSHFHSVIYIDLPHKKITHLRTVSQGTFGYIDLARHETKEEVKEVYVKRPIHKESSLLMEACIQHVVRDGLQRFGFMNHVPRVLDVFQLHDGSVCFAMDQVEGAVTLDTYLNRHPSRDLSACIVDLLYQVSMIVWVMNHGLGMNHRDLKPSNFLIRIQDTPQTYSFTVDQLQVEWTTVHHLNLIDFGFACGGSVDTHQSYLSLSTVYSKNDPCPKDGRDLFLFLALLYSDYHSRMSPVLKGLFESWIDIKGSNLCAFIQKDVVRAKRWLYFLSGSEDVRCLPCYPHLVILDIMGLRTVSDCV